jgi:hypothetical protein
MSIRDFKEAAELLIDSLSTFTATELMEYEEFVALAVLAAAVGCDRKTLKAKVGVHHNEPQLIVTDPLQLGSYWVHLLHHRIARPG